LSNNLAYLVMLIDTVFLLIPSLLIREQYSLEQVLWFDLPVLLLSSGGHLAYFITGQVALGHSVRHAVLSVPRLLLLGIQLAFNNALAAAEALIGQESEFVRTPKSGQLLLDTPAPETNTVASTAPEPQTEAASTPSLSERLYQAVRPKGGGIELLLAVVYSIVLIWAVEHQLWLMLPFLLLLSVGFTTTAIHSLRHQYRLNT